MGLKCVYLIGTNLTISFLLYKIVIQGVGGERNRMKKLLLFVLYLSYLCYL